jgi:lipopolysaccharide transport system ATP-binding protein
MSDIVISVENLSKRYLVGHQSVQRERYTALRDVIGREARSFVRKALDFVHGRQIVQGDEVEEFWALENVSFEIKRGEVLGIIGRNGAGKSTLLKILSRITEPDRGRAILHGSVASLLEVGTGFHPELTGRENIYLNGAILGMTRFEISSKFDEIVAFAEVERFLDTPVKYYSSGMYVRLAFAVAAHLEPEILIIDEVLAVGDAIFQEKCLGKIRDVATGGRTVLFVSHNMSAVMQLSHRAIVLSQGRVNFIGAPTEAVERYLHAGPAAVANFDVRTTRRRYHGTGDVRILSLRFDRSLPYFEFSEPIRFIIRIHAEHSIDKMRAGMAVFTRSGSIIGASFSPEVDGLEKGSERDLVITMSDVRLAPGSYSCAVSVGIGNPQKPIVDYDIVMDTLFFEVQPERTESGAMTTWSQDWGSIVFPELAIESRAIA